MTILVSNVDFHLGRVCVNEQSLCRIVHRGFAPSAACTADKECYLESTITVLPRKLLRHKNIRGPVHVEDSQIDNKEG